MQLLFWASFMRGRTAQKLGMSRQYHPHLTLTVRALDGHLDLAGFDGERHAAFRANL